MTVSVTDHVMPEMSILSLRRVIPDYAGESQLWADFGQLRAEAGDQLPVWLFGMKYGASYFDVDYRESDVDVAVWVEFRGEGPAPEGLEIIHLPERRVARATLRGSYEGMAEVLPAIGEWIGENGFVVDGPMFNVYLSSPRENPDPSTWITQINVPIAGRP
ncbi:MAG: GyrI-like domain-containing protein [Propionibacteriaceae bacterium]|jgi:effector-binding domain-containing protein|nr:GyrI-like domain-containing protein [Propionibacteriaceae bacterium]